MGLCLSEPDLFCESELRRGCERGASHDYGLACAYLPRSLDSFRPGPHVPCLASSCPARAKVSGIIRIPTIERLVGARSRVLRG